MAREWEFRRAVHYEGEFLAGRLTPHSRTLVRPVVIELNSGTGARIQTFIDKARSGRPFTISVIGGSVSKGRGLKPVVKTHERPAPRQLQPVDDEDAIAEDTNSTIGMVPNLGANTLYSPENMHVLIFDWLNETFPHPQNRLINGAQGGVGSGYFSWCFSGSPLSA
jgi:hypothetical protein